MSIKTLAADSEVLKKNLLYSSLTKFYNSISKEDMNLFLDIISGKSKISLRIIDWFVTNYSKKKNIVYYINNSDVSAKPLTGKNGSLKKKRFSPKSRFQENAPERVNSSTMQFFVYLRYRSQLTSYHKIKFDPFCRNDRIVNWGPNGDITTTLAQLNFFKWALENRVLEYIQKHLKEIEIDMNTNIRPNKDKDKVKTKTKTKKKKNVGGGGGGNMSGDEKSDSEETSISSSSSSTSSTISKRKRRELSNNATKTINKHTFNITLDFD
jgi:hypothetical protein